MFIHIGSKRIISDKNCIGIFNTETLLMSEINNWINKDLSKEDKSIVIADNNNIISSIVSPYTVIKRTSINNDFIWRKGHE